MPVNTPGSLGGGRAFIRKLFTVKDLSEKIAILGAGRAAERESGGGAQRGVQGDTFLAEYH